MVKKNKSKTIITKDDSDEIELDLTKIKSIITNKHFITLILILIPMFLAGYFRYYPANLPITDQWAENSIQNSLRSQFTAQINQQYPNLPDANKQQLIDTQVKQYIEQNKDGYDQAIKQNSEAIKQQFKAEDGTTYLLAIDPYYYYRQFKNLVETGHAYDEIKEDGKIYDNHMIAPIGSKLPQKFTGANFHVWFSYFVHKIITFFNSDKSILFSFFLIPMIISMLSVIPAFFLGRKVGGNVGGFFAAMIVGVHSVFLGRTPAGFSDTDAYNVFFPLLISWLFIEAFEKKDLKERLILGGLAGLASGLYSFAWTGWWYVFDFILYSMIAYIGYYIILHRSEFRKKLFSLKKNNNLNNAFLLLLVFLVVSGIFVTYFTSFNNFKNAPLAPISTLTIKDAAHINLWPNVFTTVAELNEANASQIIGQIGGKLFFVIALLGIVSTMLIGKKEQDTWFISGSAIWFILITYYHQKFSIITFILLLSLPIIYGLLMPLYKKQNIDVKYAIYFSMWFMGAVFASTKGVRFILLLVPVFSVAFGIAIGKFYEFISNWFTTEFELNKIISKSVTIVVLLLLLITPIKAADNTARNEIPSMNDGWYQSLNKIKLESQPNAIVNSWWDFGHWFKAIADRAVTFDGGSQNTPMAHWIGKSLLSSNEDVTIGILRMLDCGSNNAFEELNKVVNFTPKTIDMLNEVILLDKENARNKLEGYTDKNTADTVIELTHCIPPENYYITSEDMVGKAGVWAHFGSWDFRRAKMWIDYRKLTFDDFVDKTQNELGYDEKTANDLYYQIQTLTEGRNANTWIAPWPSYLSGLSGCVESDKDIKCQNGLIINKTTFNATISTNQGILHPKTLVYLDNGTFTAKTFDKGKVLSTQDGQQIGIALIKIGNTYYSIMMNDELTQSTFTKLFYYEGAGTTHFDKFSDIRDVTGQRIIVWKVDWDGE